MPSFLNLSRELRDMIYTHLTQPLTMILPWPWRIQPTHISHRPTNRTLIHIHHAPLLSVLLTHSQIYAEYLTSARFETAASIRLDTHGYYSTKIRNLDTRVFARIHSVSLAAASNRVLADTWQKLSDCADLLAGLAPSLSTIHVYTHLMSGLYIYHSQLAQFVRRNRAATRTWFMPAPPWVLARLPLRQCGESFFVELDKVDPRTALDEMSPPAPPVVMDYVGKLGAYCFSRSGDIEAKLFGKVNEAVRGVLRERMHSEEELEELFWYK